MEPVRCVHPAFVTHVPPRARTVRERLVRTETTVRLRRWEDNHPGRGFHVGSGDVFNAAREVMPTRDGYWERLYGADGRFCLHDDIRDYLEGRPQTRSMATALGYHFAGTPVAAHAGGEGWTGQDVRGDDPAGRGLGDVRTDGRAEASGVLAGWLDENVRLLGGGVILRARPVAVASEILTAGGGWRMHGRRPPHAWGLVAAGDAAYPRVRALRPPADIAYAPDIETWQRLSEDRPDPEADLALMLNVHAGPVLAELNRSILKGARSHEDQVWLIGLRDALAPVARRARLGLAGTQDMVAEAGALCRAVEGAGRFPAVRAHHEHRIGRLDRSLAEFVAPRIAAMADAALPREDIEAFAGLAP